MIRWRWDQVIIWLVDSDPTLGAEIGVKEGRFTKSLLSSFPDLTIVAIDPWEPQPNGEESYKEWDFDKIYKSFVLSVDQSRVVIKREYSEVAAKSIKDGSLDFAFIDAQHDHDSVAKDISLWLPKVRPGGLLCGHDYEPGFPGVMTAVVESKLPFVVGGNATWAHWKI